MSFLQPDFTLIFGPLYVLVLYSRPAKGSVATFGRARHGPVSKCVKKPRMRNKTLKERLEQVKNVAMRKNDDYTKHYIQRVT